MLRIEYGIGSRMSYKRLLSLMVLAISIATLVGCGKKEVEESVVEESAVSIRDKFDDMIPSLCFENIGNEEECLLAIDEVLSELDVSVPYTLYNNTYQGQSQRLTFDVLDNRSKLVHVDVRGTTGGVKVHYVYDTSEEDKAAIAALLREMLGESVYVVVEDTYKDYVVAHAQGNEYRWKDGHLERVPR